MERRLGGCPVDRTLIQARAETYGGKYRALRSWLRSQQGDQINMSFGEIEKILGFDLPMSCRKRHQHWHGYAGSAVARALADAGWKARDVRLKEERVSFERM